MIESAKASGNAEAASQLEAVSSVVVEVKNKILEVQAKIDKATQAVGAATEQAEATAAEVEAAAAAAGALLGGASARNAQTTRRFVVDCAKKVESRYNGSVFYARDRWTNKRVGMLPLCRIFLGRGGWGELKGIRKHGAIQPMGFVGSTPLLPRSPS